VTEITSNETKNKLTIVTKNSVAGNGCCASQ